MSPGDFRLMTPLSLVVLLSACGAPDVACSGPLPVSCECVAACEVTDAGTVFALDPAQVCVPRCWRRDAP